MTPSDVTTRSGSAAPPAADRVLVVGGTRGTGLLIARRLLHDGHRVRVLARDPRGAKRRLPLEVEVVAGDITKPDTLIPATRNARHIVFTAGVRSARFAREDLVRRTDYEGVLHTLTAARAAGFGGRFLYMNSIGVATPSPAATILNLAKRNTLVWRLKAEHEIRASGLDYTIIRVGFLLNGPRDRRTVEIGQDALPLALRHRIARADVAEAFVAALSHPRASQTTFEIVRGAGRAPNDWGVLLNGVRPDG